MRHWDTDYILNLNKQLLDNCISPAEFVADFLLQKFSHTPLFFIDRFEDLDRSSFQKNKLLKNLSFSSPVMTFINEHHWKGYTDRIRRSLLLWHQGQYSLVLCKSIPSPYELLKIQACGQRVVTVFEQPDQWRRLHHQKNVWDFTVHDLIHADHFFENPMWREGQVQFYQFLLHHWNSQEIKPLHKTVEFEYLISDMNSHPRHLFQTLQALTLKSVKQTFQIPHDKTLSSIQEAQFQNLIQSWKSELDFLDI